MPHLDSREWLFCAEACAFFGNSLLRPMTQTSPVGLDPNFWDELLTYAPQDDAFRCALVRCRHYACAVTDDIVGAESAALDAAQQTAVEYARLFIGPPHPAAPPWETMHGSSESVGFGSPAFAMRELLRDAGLELTGENNQYADHVGIELLYLSEMCCRRAMGKASADDNCAGDQALSDYLDVRLLSWIQDLCSQVEREAPKGYYIGILRAAEALLVWQHQSL